VKAFYIMMDASEITSISAPGRVHIVQNAVGTKQFHVKLYIWFQHNKRDEKEEHHSAAA
jgi:hypothetical protein